MNRSIHKEGQARNIIYDARNSGLTKAEAELGLQRALGASRNKIDNISIIGENYFLSGGP